MTKNTAAVQKFGTFGGVFVPNVLTILGVVMFLRTGWVVGNAGLTQALIILCLAKSITLLTSLSLSAIATNTKAEGGGAYFLVSRSLGIEAGCSIGAPLFLAQAISVAFYIIGFSESLQFLYPEIQTTYISLVVLAILLLIAWVGAGAAVKAQYLILGCLVASLISFFAGYQPIADISVNLSAAYDDGQTFWTVFAIFFPAVTGIMAGVSMSGDLKDPSRSIPKGTLWAVGVTFVIYAVEMLWFAMNASREELQGNTLIMRDIARVPGLILLGLWAASLSSALASLVAAPRTLQALARDKLIPRFVGRAFGPQREPRIALLITALLTVVCLMAGSFNMIAPVISMFFLGTYAMINLTAGLECWTKNPSYRPTFKIHWSFSVLGGISCLVIMFMLDSVAASIALVVIAAIYLIVARRSFSTAWGDSWSGFWFSVIRFSLFKLTASQKHITNWRPILLVITDNPKYQHGLIRFADYFEAQRGLVFIGYVLSGDWRKHLPKQKMMQKTLDDYIQDNHLSAVSNTIISSTFEEGATAMMQISGMGRLKPNTTMISWSENWLKDAAFSSTIRHILELEKNLLVYEKAKLEDDELNGTIDIWWSAKENGSMMLTLAYLLQSNPGWRRKPIRILRIIKNESGKEQALEGTLKMLEESRIEAEPTIIVDKDTPPLQVIATESGRSLVAFVGVSTKNTPTNQRPLAIYEPLIESLKGHAFLTKNWQELEL